MERGPTAPAVLRELQQLGVGLVLDDFGTGWSSLCRLRHLPITGLKVDRSFVAELESGGGDERADRRRHRADEPRARPRLRGRGDRDARAGRPPARAGLPLGAGLPLRPARWTRRPPAGCSRRADERRAREPPASWTSFGGDRRGHRARRSGLVGAHSPARWRRPSGSWRSSSSTMGRRRPSCSMPIRACASCGTRLARRCRRAQRGPRRGGWPLGDFLDDDDRLRPGMVERALAAVAASTLAPPHAALCAIEVLDGDGSVLGRRVRPRCRAARASRSSRCRTGARTRRSRPSPRRSSPASAGRRAAALPGAVRPDAAPQRGLLDRRRRRGGLRAHARPWARMSRDARLLPRGSSSSSQAPRPLRGRPGDYADVLSAGADAARGGPAPVDSHRRWVARCASRSAHPLRALLDPRRLLAVVRERRALGLTAQAGSGCSSRGAAAGAPQTPARTPRGSARRREARPAA